MSMIRVLRSASHLIVLLLVMVLSATWLAPTAPVQAQDPCEGLVTPQLAPGGAGRVVATYGLKLKNQAAPSSAGGRDLSTLAFGTIFEVVEGPTCRYGYVWWSVRLADGSEGWLAEGAAGDYYVEPYTVTLHAFRLRDNGANVGRFAVGPDGFASQDATFTVTPASSTPRESWQQVESDYLGQALESIQQLCPQRLDGTVFAATATLDEALDLALPALDYDMVPSPSGQRLLLVRHLTLDVPRCSTVIPEKVGISQVSILDMDGTETVLFPYPQHGSVPQSTDRYDLSEQDRPNVYLSEVVWSPNEQYIAFVVGYKDTCSGQGCYRFHLYVWDREAEQLYVHGEGRHVGWQNGGERINFFRLIPEGDGRRLAHLYSMRPNGQDRQEIWLPGGAVYVSSDQTPLGFPWNDSGSRVLVGNGGVEEVMLFSLADRAFTDPILVPDQMPRANRLDVDLVKGESELLWSTIRGEFVMQVVRSGDWTPLQSTVATFGVAPLAVRPFGDGLHALVEMVDGTAYVLNLGNDTLTQVMVRQAQ